MKFSKYVVALFIILFGCAFAGSAYARDYSFPQLIIDVNVAADGTLAVAERRTVEFDGRYTGLFQWINLQGDMEISNVTVSENGVVYEYNDAHDIGPEGTYFAEERDGQMYIDWSFVAEDETRTFTVSYDVKNVIVVHDDVAELYYQFVGDKWEEAVQHALVTVNLPAGATRDELRAWGHGPLHGEVQIVDGQTVQWETSPLGANRMLEGRLTFPPKLVPNAPIHTGRVGLPGILSEEEEWAEDANRRRGFAQADWRIAIGLVVASIISAILFWRKYGKAHSADFDGEYFRELPQDYSPAELGVLWSMGQVGVQDLTATLLDLARRKFVKLEEYELEEKGVFRSKTTTDYRIVRLDNAKSAASHEEMLLEFLFEEVNQGEEAEVTLKDIEKYAKKQRKKFAKFWSDWQQEVKVLADGHGFFETHHKAQATGIVVSILIMLVSIPLFIYSFPFSGLGLIVGGLILLLTAASLRRRTKAGNNDYVRWKAFRRFLEHFSEISRSEVPALVIWEHYLVYAVTLGVAKEVLKQLEIVFPNLQDGNYHFGYGWYYYGVGGPTGLHQGLTDMTNSVQNSFAQSIQIATGQSSSGSGAGGGFSGGGGGGFGGGGGGAR